MKLKNKKVIQNELGAIDFVNGLNNHKTKNLPSNSKIVDYVRNNHELFKEAAIFGNSQIKSILPVSGSIYCVLSLINKESASEFLRCLATGENLKSGNPIYALRERLINIKGLNSNIKKKDLLLYITLAWNYYIEQKKIIHLKKIKKQKD